MHQIMAKVGISTMIQFSSWQHFVEYMHDLNTFSIFIRLLMSVVFGGILGIDRARKNRPAGFRTFMLVCMSAALVMITNQFLAVNYSTDPARLGAQVISGIGFLGAGTIIVTRSNHVMGLTTAAGLWAAACVGLAIGLGFYSAAFFAEIFVILIIIFLNPFDTWLHSSTKVMEVYGEFDSPETVSNVISFAHSNAIKISHVEIMKSQNPLNHIGALMTLRLPKKVEHSIVVEQFARIEGVVFLEEV